MADDDAVPTPIPSPDDLPQPVRAPTPASGRRVEPNPDVPKLRRKTEERLAPADEKSAQGYDALERAGELVLKFKEKIDDGRVQVQLEVTDTAVHSLKKI